MSLHGRAETERSTLTVIEGTADVGAAPVVGTKLQRARGGFHTFHALFPLRHRWRYLGTCKHSKRSRKRSKEVDRGRKTVEKRSKNGQRGPSIARSTFTHWTASKTTPLLTGQWYCSRCVPRTKTFQSVNLKFKMGPK